MTDHPAKINQCFSSISTPNAKILILGSMPGIKSLQEQQYYAHPRNAFWKIMQSITKVAPNANYQQRTSALSKKQIALWDVVQSCERKGSLDSNIISDSIRINDFKTFFDKHQKLQFIGLNGTKAFQLFIKYIVKQNLLPQDIAYAQLPSTSPAHASMNFQTKSQIWLKYLKND